MAFFGAGIVASADIPNPFAGVYQIDFAHASGPEVLADAGFAFARAGPAWTLDGEEYPAGSARVIAGAGFLIEGSRANLIPSSNGTSDWSLLGSPFVTANTIDGPDRVREADEFACTAEGQGAYLGNIAVTPGTIYALSGYFAKVGREANQINFGAWGITGGNVSVRLDFATNDILGSIPALEPNGLEAIELEGRQGWLRPWVAATAAPGVSTGGPFFTAGPSGGSIVFCAWGLQMEAGGFASSPILTHGSSVARAGETCIAARALTQGTVVIRARTAPGPPPAGGRQVLWQLDDDTDANRITIRRDPSRAIVAEAVAAGAPAASLVLGTMPDDTTFAVGLSFAAHNFSASLDGLPPVTDVAGAMPAIARERLGHDRTAGGEWFGWIMAAELHDTRLDDAGMVPLVVQHALIGSGTMSAMPADSLADMVGVNTRMGIEGSPSETGFASIVKPALLDLGIRHVRDVAGTTATAPLIELANAGIDSLVVTWPETGLGWDFAASANLAAGFPAITAIEPPDERDIAQAQYDWGVGWPSTMRTYMEAMWAARLNGPALAGVSAIGPAFADPIQSPMALSGVFATSADYMDAGNVHGGVGAYPEGPEGGWTGLTAGDILARAAIVSGEHPVWVTSSGWKLTGASAGFPVVTERAAAKYLLRALAFCRAYGIPRFYVRDLLPPTAGADFGICAADGTPRLAGEAIKNLIALFSDPGASLAPATLTYALTGDASDTYAVLFQKADGRMLLVLWQAVPSSSGGAVDGTAADIEPPRRDLILTLGTTFAQVNQYEPTFGAAPIATATNASAVAVSVPDHLLVVELIPMA